MKSKKLIYYSINSYLAFWINENFYNNHFVWCAPVFDPSVLNEYDQNRKIPPSSAPAKIYKRYLEDVEGGDLHSAKIIENKTGLKKGAIINFESGNISEIELARINKIIDSALINEFRPLIYIIPSSMVKTKLKLVDVELTANPLSMEYQVPELNTNEFDIIEL